MRTLWYRLDRPAVVNCLDQTPTKGKMACPLFAGVGAIMFVYLRLYFP